MRFIVLLCALSVLPFQGHSQVYRDLCPYTWAGDLFVDVVKIDNPEVSFYGLTFEPAKPGFTFDCDLVTASVGVQLAVGLPIHRGLCFFGKECQLIVRDRILYGSHSQHKSLFTDTGELINLFAIDGSGFGGEIPRNQDVSFHTHETYNEFDLLLARPICLGGGFVLYPAVGYSMLYRQLEVKSQLHNNLSGFDNGTITETIRSFYNGLKVEFALSKEFCSTFTAQIIPYIAAYNMQTQLNGKQTWGENPFEPVSLRVNKEEGAYLTGCRFVVDWSFGCYQVGVEVFGEFLSRVNGLYNPRHEDDGPARLTDKNRTIWGSGLHLGRYF